MTSPASRLTLGLERRSLGFIALLCLGHLMVDLHQGAVPALLPALKDQLGLSYAETGLILSVLSVTASFAQPAIGYLSDIGRYPWLIPFGILLAPLGMALLGFAPSYGWILAAVVLVGAGAAAYHPEAARTAASLAGSRQGTGMALWVVGGNFGYALGPLFVLAILSAGGLRAAVWSLPAGLAVAGLTWAWLGRLADSGAAGQPGRLALARADLPPTAWGAEALLVTMVVVRTLTFTGLVAFLPFYYVEVMGGAASLREALQSLLLFGSVFGTLLGGHLADRFGIRRVIAGSFLLSLPLIPLALKLTGLPLYVTLFAIGCALASTATLATVLGQQYMPRYASVSAGLTIGFSMGVGGVLVGLLGRVADAWGVGPAVWLLAGLPALGLAMAMLLPPPPQRPAAATGAAVDNAG